MSALLTADPVEPIATEFVAVAPRMDRDWNGRLMTPEEFDAVEDYDDEYSYELINGVVIVSPIPLEAEADPVEELGRLLRNYGELNPQGRALDATLSERYIRLSNSRRKADRVIWAGLGRRPNSATDVPTIAVEFVSAGKRNRTRDYVIKRREYLFAGVKEYWIIDRFRRRMTVVQLVDGVETETIVSESDRYSTPLLPGFELPLSRLLGFADRWTESGEVG